MEIKLALDRLENISIRSALPDKYDLDKRQPRHNLRTKEMEIYLDN